MKELLLDVRAGATAGALLGALVELGASLERIQQAVGALGDGDVRIAVRGGRRGSLLRVRAPQGAPTADTWAKLRPHVLLLALDETVVDLTVSVLDELFAARAAVHGIAVGEVDIDPFSGPDDLANAVALAAATIALGPPDVVRSSAIGHGAGTMATIEGPVPLPGPVVAVLLEGRDTIVHDIAEELLDPLAAAYLRAATTGPEAGVGTDLISMDAGHGRLPGTDADAVLVASLHRG